MLTCGILNEFKKNEVYNDIYVTETVYVKLNSTLFAKFNNNEILIASLDAIKS